MARRDEIAVRSVHETDLRILCDALKEACDEALQEGVAPPLDPAVMLLSYQIAFAGNGDFRDRSFYKALYEYCHSNKDAEEREGEPPGLPITDVVC